MEEQTKTISPSEWEIMRLAWTLGELTSTQARVLMAKKRGWQPTTVKTLLARLVKKGYLAVSGEVRSHVYRPLISEDSAMAFVAETAFSGMCAMKVGQTLGNLLVATPLTKTDISRLQEILTKKMVTAPEHIACNCLPDGSSCEKEMTGESR
ncbi:CopY/TcrY family copper transport repressor [Pseudolactococcus insecticola]|uniref:Uracil phosphoribosyltransferase n=1 Tax=Pseudolactococcus insecticola TaxID=2709158 RepID=A0A6A0B9G8_9LACT|nr:CopY/TcrY family copper transport repressor [Lactococcus insecticola]GFH41101.1 uracil phosphoribosyltransferase [Lactococcus insecticola]